MISSIRFLHATMVHKWHVYHAGRRLGVGRWQLLIHDLSKFRPTEFVPYGKFFYALPGAGWLKAVQDPSARLGMLEGWLRHIQRNPHHWQYWVLVNGASVVATRKITSHGRIVEANPIEALPMPREYVFEMVADWMGAGRAYQGEYPKSVAEWKWWQDNKDQIILHPESRAHLTRAICDWFNPDIQPTAEHILYGTTIDNDEYVWGSASPSH